MNKDNKNTEFDNTDKNLNISNISDSDLYKMITKGFSFIFFDEDVIITKDYEKNGEDRFVEITKRGTKKFNIQDKDIILNYLKNHYQ
jgi:hypothetical protein